MVLLAPAHGCAGSRHTGPIADSGPVEAEARPEPSPDAAAAVEADVPQGAFHRVEAGQTSWRIARTYGIDLEALTRANRITDPDLLVVGQILFVPGATSTREVLPYPAPLATRPEPEGKKQRRERSVGAFVWPVPAGEVLSPFGAPRRGHRHAGLDIRGVLGQEVLATEGGEVIYSGDTLGDYGKMVILRHGDRLRSVYAHNSKLLVSAGDRVERGQPVALVGRTGNASTAHCHFELRKDDIPVDPIVYLAGLAPSATTGGIDPPNAVGSAGPAHRTGKPDGP